MENKYSRNDLSIGELVRFRTLERAFLNRCSQFGYHEIKTATIEPLHLFTAPGVLSDAKLRRIYSFIDWDGWSGERVSLRPDSSTCVVRFYNEHLRARGIRQKLCYVENHFEWADSGDAISERWQCGVENIGEPTPEADIEVIYMAYDILRDIWPRPFFLTLSCPAVVKEMVRVLTDRRSDTLTAAIKDGSAEVALAELPGGEVLANLLGVRGESAVCLKNLRPLLCNEKFISVLPVLDNFVAVCDLLDGIDCRYVVDFSSLLDLEYYTGVSFQILSTETPKSRRDVLCSGGRYDSLIGNLEGEETSTPATGFALYVRNILAHLPELREKTRNIMIYIESLTRSNVTTGQTLCNRLAELGFSVQISFAPPAEAAYEGFGLVIQVDREKFSDGYKILYSQKIDKPLLTSLFGELNAR